ncbi:MAG TPA: MFS transporter, partial [Ktedonobacterales bacterium]|nr:MFS transporter [Ktedonobacterales bacterium]
MAKMDVDAGMGAGADRREAGLRALWRNASYLLLWAGQAVSSVGTQLSQIAYPLLVLALTGSAAQAGFLGAARTFPYLLLGLPAGALVDRWNRKRLMMLCDAGRALLLGSIPLALLLGRLTLAQLYVVAVAEGALNVFFNLANTAALTRVVTKAQLPIALAQDEVTLSAGFTAGPALGGALFSLGRALPFLADAISYAISVGSLLFIKTPFQGERSSARRKLRAEIGEGLRWLWSQPLIRFMAFLTGGLNFTSGLTLIIIVIAQRQHATSFLIGLVFAIGSIGGVVGSVIGPAI